MVLRLEGRFGELVPAVWRWRAVPVGAVDVGVAGVFPGKALLIIDRGASKTVPVGGSQGRRQRSLSVDGDSVTIESDGKRRILQVEARTSSRSHLQQTVVWW
ncbi:MAG: hypothetical protein H6942_04135 [Candidatus Accumulibacter sp.]|uniref:hypothetical protein n=1 Tax=Accumulibacter sp. TaxID=2053492 RepID=UPI0025F477BF|nr:hypothetical protein [Accumulibacter sp.]MCP5247725.1 hypothetical protein [Accumulibacter sp.]